MDERENHERYKKAMLGLFNAQEVGGIVVHSGKDSPAFVASMVFKIREIFGMGKKITAKPGPKLNFVHTGMLDADGQPKKKKKRSKDKQHRQTAKIKQKRKKAATKTIKKRTKKETKDRLDEIDRELKELEGKL